MLYPTLNILSIPPSSPPPQDLVISAYIPQEYQHTIMSRCRWEDSQQRWAVDHVEWAGNLVRRVLRLLAGQPGSFVHVRWRGSTVRLG